MASRHDKTLSALLDRHGQTYSNQAGLRLRDTPSPLFGLLVLSLLLSTRISGDIAVAAAHALRKQGWTTPAKMASSTWAQRTRTLNKSGYARYDESTSRMLGDTVELLESEYRGDLRRLHDEAKDSRDLRRLLMSFKGMGDVGADIFCREVQAVWPDVYPFVDKRAAEGAKAVGLPSSTQGIAKLVSQDEFPRLVAACIRVKLAKDADEVKAEARQR
ncbi:MAG: endonuclease [Streptosporangiales bacterium]